jgi:predicted Zn-dependent protease
MTLMTDTDRLFEAAERVLSRLPEGAEGEVRIEVGREALTRFAQSFIHQNVSDDVTRISLRVSLEGRIASASRTQTDDAALTDLVDSAVDAARLQPEDPGWPGLAPRGEAPDAEHWDQPTADAGPDRRAATVRAFVDAADGLETAGYCASDAVLSLFVNSAGQRLSGRVTRAVVDGIARTATSDGSGRMASASLLALDGGAAGGDAARRAREASDPGDIDPGRYEVVLEPGCVTDLLTFLAMHGFNARAVEEGRSFARVGETQFDEQISLRDDIADPISIGLPFDVEGTPKRRLDLVREGVTSGLVHDRRTARALGAESTGHAIEGGAEWGALPANLILSPGSLTRDALVGAVERGLLVTDFWYTRILDPRTQMVTGLTRNGVWLIEDGRITRPVRNLRFTQSYLEALAPGAVRGVGSDVTLVPGGAFGLGAYGVPSLHLASWNFTGGARG